MKILAFAGSNSSVSINKKLVTHVASYFREHEVEVLDLNHYEMPIYSYDREKSGGIPQLAQDFAAKIDGSNLLIISLAEHNGAYSTAFKNIYDWISRIKTRKPWGDKPIFLMATSPGGRGGATVLGIAKDSLPRYGGNVIETFSLPKFAENFDEAKGITSEALKKELETRVAAVKALLV